MTICAEFDGRSWQQCTRGILGCVCGLDRPERAAHVLEQFDRWRKGETGAPDFGDAHAAIVSGAIATAVKVLRTPGVNASADAQPKGGA